jgi:hypothetical protein
LFAAVHLLLRRQSGFFSVQGQHNQNFAATRSLPLAIADYPKVRPPLYPLLLWLGARMGFRPRLVNEALLDLSLVLFWLAARRAVPQVHPAWPVALFTLLTPNYTSAYQSTAEILFVPLLLALLLALDRHLASHSDVDLGLATLAAAALNATRYFSLFGTMPVLALAALRPATSWPRRLRRTGLSAALALVPVGAWMLATYFETGYLTGADRGGERSLPHAVRHWTQLQGFAPTLELAGKTLWVDFFAPDVHATLWVVTNERNPKPVEWAAAGLALAAAVVGWRARPRASAAMAIAAALLANYLAATIALWTFGNNDPLYSRFLFPAYPLLMLLGFFLYAGVRTSSLAVRLPFFALYGALVAIHLGRDWAAVPVPFR